MPHHKTFDLLTGYCVDKGELPGIRLWPANRKWKQANLRILCLGGSTTATLNNWQWPRFLAEKIEKDTKFKPLIFNAAAAGYASDQELLRLLRDGPGIRPHVVISLSGINDIGFLHGVPPHSFINPFQVNIAKSISESSPAMEGYSLGIPWRRTAAENWLRNIRLSHIVAKDLSAAYLAFLQPTLGYKSAHATNDREVIALERAGSQSANGVPYLEALSTFYNDVTKALYDQPYINHIFDITDCMKGESDVWEDQRHQNAKGNRVISNTIANTLFPVIENR